MPTIITADNELLGFIFDFDWNSIRVDNNIFSHHKTFTLKFPSGHVTFTRKNFKFENHRSTASYFVLHNAQDYIILRRECINFVPFNLVDAE